MFMKSIELKIVSELMKNSHRSDREVARKIGTSQPTVTRTRTRLEKQGTIREYTMIPDYAQLGFRLMSITFARLKEPLSKQAVEEASKIGGKMLHEHPTAILTAMNGIGLNADRVVIAFHRDYNEYAEFMAFMKQCPPVAVDHVKSFVVNLLDKNQFQPLSFIQLAEYLTTLNDRVQTERKTRNRRRQSPPNADQSARV
jgi:DNA-binding Lrp family transcriptional regulator